MARGRPSKKAHIVTVASGLFTEQGYQSTSIDQVVLAAAVSKPTVYSNFPAKLVLWENVLTALIEQAQDTMQTRLDTLQVKKDITLISGWIVLWEEWINKPEHLAVYRILLGEQHKMAPSTFALFAEFEAVLESTLQAWIAKFSVSPMNFFALKAISREALLTPALMNQPMMDRAELVHQLDGLMKDGSFLGR
ncbi:TetR/AcrR family transcriptional regulator [Marinomonas sp. M1K-6]|uniref:TetR/AcrR family transcriptional regulator n=1 Tax=Marinomonas profundi TaxID=2726122 RepID=A0A847QWT7_9GAMM|nr:TetR/AcrR family transcriptional regulator [Marinomonas profundi]NLQ17928.1 TetR/AcrR family transcriptional regulator [Marinomonas profundi]UDV03418.1 TetR/AcrR family transcriptional regulator [Marinomonas profundi]